MPHHNTPPHPARNVNSYTLALMAGHGGIDGHWPGIWEFAGFNLSHEYSLGDAD